jgi:hypothetical protein
VNTEDAEMFEKILNLKKQYDAKERAESELGRTETERLAYNLHKKRREHEYCKAMIYHTVAIEGNQMSLEEVGTLYDFKLDKSKRKFRNVNILGDIICFFPGFAIKWGNMKVPKN